jgi:hypothetical protein
MNIAELNVDERIKIIQDWFYNTILFLFKLDENFENPTTAEIKRNSGGKSIAYFREKKSPDEINEENAGLEYHDLVIIKSKDGEPHKPFRAGYNARIAGRDDNAVVSTIVEKELWKTTYNQELFEIENINFREQWTEISDPLLHFDFSNKFDENPFVPIIKGIPNYYHIRNADEVVGNIEFLREIITDDKKNIIGADLPLITTVVNIFMTDKRYKEKYKQWEEFIDGLAKGKKYLAVALILIKTGYSWSNDDISKLIGVTSQKVSEYRKKCRKEKLIGN